MNKFKSVIVFIVCKDDILLLNRNKKFWMGMWNCVGGKIEKDEEIDDAAIRETYEETGIVITKEQLNYVADLKWYFDEDEADGGYCYLVYLDEYNKDDILKTPVNTNEGILDWKKIDWVLNKDNKGIVPDIFKLLPVMFECYKKGTFKTVCAYYDKEDRLYKIEEEGEIMDKIKDGFKKAGYTAVGAGAVIYEKGKEVYENIAPKINKISEKGEEFVGKINKKIDELALKGEEICKKKDSANIE